MIYNSLIYPFLLYGVPIWGNADEVHLRPIFTTQKKAVRIISNKTGFLEDSFVREHSAPLFKQLKLLNIYDIFKVEALKFVFDSVNKNNPRQFHSFYSYPTNRHINTAANRNNHLNVPLIRTSNYGIKSLKFTGVVLWNNLSFNDRTSVSKAVFSMKIKSYFIDQYE